MSKSTFKNKISTHFGASFKSFDVTERSGVLGSRPATPKKQPAQIKFIEYLQNTVQELKEQLQTSEKNRANLQLQFGEKLREISAQQRIMAEKLRLRKEKIRLAEEEAARTRAQLQKREKEQESSQEALNAAKRQISNLEEQNEVLRGQVAELQRLNESLRKSNEQMTGKMSSLRTLQTGINSEVSRYQELFGQFQAQLKDTAAKLARKSRQTAKLKLKVEAMAAEIGQKDAEMQELGRELDCAQQRAAKAEKSSAKVSRILSRWRPEDESAFWRNLQGRCEESEGDMARRLEFLESLLQ